MHQSRVVFEALAFNVTKKKFSRDSSFPINLLHHHIEKAGPVNSDPASLNRLPWGDDPARR